MAPLAPCMGLFEEAAAIVPGEEGAGVRRSLAAFAALDGRGCARGGHLPGHRQIRVECVRACATG